MGVDAWRKSAIYRAQSDHIRNGKSENVLARCLWALTHGERVLYTAHRATTSHAVWERLDRMCGKAGIIITSSFKAFGKEHLYAKDGSVVEFRTRTSSGGLGEGYDVLIIDEAQEYTEAQETSLKYIVSDSDNPQTIMLGTPPTVVSAGTVFIKFRETVLSGKGFDSGWAEWSVDFQTDPNDVDAWYETNPSVSAGTVFIKFRETVLSGKGFDSGWAEWSVDFQTDPNDVDAWYETNPSLGTILTERKIRAEITTDDIDFNIQRLGLWLKYNQKSEISKKEWLELKVDEKPKIVGDIFVGIKYGNTGEHVSMAVAVKTSDGKNFVEALDCRPVRAGTDWILEYLTAINPRYVIVDGANGQQMLKDDMKDARMRQEPIFPKVSEKICDCRWSQWATDAEG